MKKIVFIFTLITLFAQLSFAQAPFKGSVFDENKEPLIGAIIQLKGVSKSYNAVAGLDGSFSLPVVPAGSYTLEISFVGFKTYQLNINFPSTNPKGFDVILEPDSQVLGEVVVMGAANRGSDAQARKLEQMAKNTINVVSAKSIELSPDITVANVVQRVSGLSIERNASGDPQYAIVRGMDKRYNYTLVNGVKIPSPDNRNRYVPLDIFPAQMLERLEVAKSLTPDMEGDAIGGSVNLVMKSAPDEFEVNADFQMGYNAIHFTRPFYS